MPERFLEKVYDVDAPEEMRRLYDDWAGSYDEELTEAGYATPGRVADALARYLSDKTAPILDFGCGTGLCGAELKSQGYQAIDGADVAQEMLATARGKGIYRSLHHLSPGDPPPQGPYSAITAAGVIGPGAAPLSTLGTLAASLPKGGFLVFSFNDHALSDPAAKAAVNEQVDCGAMHLLMAEYGPHLPSENIKSIVYVMEKA